MSLISKNHPYHIGAASICLISILWSIFQDKYQYDPHHWGLMLSNAQDISNGLAPYRDIFIQYGILTTLIHASAFIALGGTLSTLALVTSIFYSLGLFLLFLLSKEVLKSNSSAIYVFLLAFLFHPLIIMPWSNYIAFPFLMAGLLFDLKESNNRYIDYFFSGLFFSLAILTREGLFPSIILIITISIIFDFLNPKVLALQTSKRVACKVLAFLTPLVIFYLYLAINDLLPYWKLLSIELPKIYIYDLNPHVLHYLGLPNFLNTVIYYGKEYDVRWILIGSLICFNLLCLVLCLLRYKKIHEPNKILIISFASLLLLSSAIHISDIFRVATGSIVGLIPLLYFFGSYRKILFFFLAAPLAVTLVIGNSGNKWRPSYSQILEGRPVIKPKIFYGQSWKDSILTYYVDIQSDLFAIQKSCQIKFQYNFTQNGFFQTISPIPQHQLSPFYLSDEMRKLRPDLEPPTSNNPNRNSFVYILNIDAETLNTFTPFEGFRLYSKHPTPNTNQITLLLTPLRCIN